MDVEFDDLLHDVDVVGGVTGRRDEEVVEGGFFQLGGDAFREVGFAEGAGVHQAGHLEKLEHEFHGERVAHLGWKQVHDTLEDRPVLVLRLFRVFRNDVLVEPRERHEAGSARGLGQLLGGDYLQGGGHVGASRELQPFLGVVAHDLAGIHTLGDRGVDDATERVDAQGADVLEPPVRIP